MIYSLKNDGNRNITTHFKIKEFRCKDGSDEIIIEEELCIKLEQLRNKINKPVHILSGFRTNEYNKKINGAKGSYHLTGSAADIKVEGVDPKIIAIYAAKVGFNGIGVYDSFVHVDIRKSDYYWIGG